MTSPFFEIRTPRDLLEKAKRDYSHMEAETSTDTVFNFFVTIYHVVDYVKALGTVPEAAIKKLYDDPDFKMCQFLCNKGKHIKLRQLQSYEAKYQPAITGGALDSFPLGSGVLGGPESYVVFDGNKEVDTIDLGVRLLQKWDAFFATHGIT
jgi:hypothetical protein